MNKPRTTAKRAASKIADKYIRPDGGKPSEPSKDQDIDLVAEVERLAALDKIHYEATRTEAAKRLGVRAHILDKEVERVRRALGLAEEVNADDGQGRAVKINDVLPWHEPVDGDMLATMLNCAVKTYVVFREESRDAAADAVVFWILHTWLVNSFRISPRLAITAPTKGCGKTRVLELLNLLVRRPRPAGSVTPPALFRTIEKFQPTMLLDENEKYLEIGSEFHAMLNQGHAKGATVLRVLGEKLELREFSVFGAVAFARNGKVPDDLEQRSIIIEMHRRKPDELLTQLPEDSESLKRMRRMCARWAEDHAAELADADPDMSGLINRNADNWRPLFTIADCIGGEWPARVRQAVVALAPGEADSFDTTLLADVKAVFDGREGESADRMFSEMLAEGLASIEGSAWAEYGKARKPITKNQLARLLGKFKIIPTTVWIGSKSLKGYQRQQFEDAWTRYLALPPFETSMRQVPTAAGLSTPFQNVSGNVNDESQNVRANPQNVNLTFQKSEKPLGANGSDELTFQKEYAPARVCAQCGAADDGHLRPHHNGGGGPVWLHPECVRFWGDQTQADDDPGIPGFLRRPV
jgi:putative DNA primase/helicase